MAQKVHDWIWTENQTIKRWARRKERPTIEGKFHDVSNNDGHNAQNDM